MKILGITFAHRGLHNKYIPENSMLSFYKALIKKKAIELDIRMLKDKKIVVFHDKNLLRMTGINKNIEKCTYEEIKNLKLKNTSEKIPLLEDVLKMIDNKIPILIELKNTKVGLEKELIKLLNNYDNFLLQTFSKKSIEWFNINKPNYIKGILTFHKINVQKLKGIDFIGIPIELSYQINKIKKPIFIWNIDSKEKYKFAKKYNASFIVDYDKLC